MGPSQGYPHLLLSSERMRWDLLELRGHVTALFGPDQLAVVNSCLRTIQDRLTFAGYHWREAERLTDSFMAHREPWELTAAMMGAYDTTDQRFVDARFQAYAHVVACVHSMHALFDNTTHLVYFALGLNLPPARKLDERDVTWGNVRKLLPAGDTRDGLQAWIDSPEFGYITALSNHSKHRSIISVPYSVNFEEEDVRHGLRFSPFECYGIQYPAKWALPTLSEEYGRQEASIFRIGTSINEALKARAAEAGMNAIDS